ncbi:MAG TPA: acyclic terpene utilization AtuA family protein [Dictyoglomaceae bacterium]|nr:acyclic terpene utilization AtuA family protein [Dictyoglomaceae bacterium]HOL38940.1 acyclic terpene utilization AtuA family protein [Dictyoglomaceae bacterium]HOP94872.1 acyclic terpene utilization AtuA family protein [Dictyoglomaceae bacterium]HPP15643.1 acyclic terpene utilization AtuA family protein [Dictyoglomaceae bacterium]HPU43823.1 acyclic terpene utilization AtuA family protein [Dictyoglomaceae bacterium]
MFKVYSPTAILGYGFSEESFENALRLKPDVIAVDAGSTDPGPYYLGKGISFVERYNTKRDLFYLLKMTKSLDIPLLIGSAGGCGTKSSVDWTFEIIKEICKENNWKFRIAKVYTDISKDFVKKALLEGNIKTLDGSKEFLEKDLERVTNIVAQIGIDPFIEAYKKDVNIVLCGRSYDPSPFAVLPILYGYPKGLSLHLGKILECGAIAAEPGSGRDGIMGVVYEDHFEVFPLIKTRKCTVNSVAAHTLYEKSDPYYLHGPDGVIDLTSTQFIQKDENTVIIEGSKFIDSKEKWLKIEGAALLGIRGVCIAGIRDPIMLSQIEDILSEHQKIVDDVFKEYEGKYKIYFHLYGKNGVMGEMEKEEKISHEIGLIIEVIGENIEIAKSILGFLRSTLLHYGYKGRISTAGNLAFPFSPSEVIWGEAYSFVVYHLIKLQDYDFPVLIEEV